MSRDLKSLIEGMRQKLGALLLHMMAATVFDYCFFK